MKTVFRSSSPTLAERYPLAAVAGIVDFFLILVGSYLAHFMRFNDMEMSEHYLLATVVLALVSILCQIFTGCYQSWRGRPLLLQLWRLYLAWVFALAAVSALAVMLKVSDYYSRIWLGSTVVASLCLLTAFRVGVFNLFRVVRARGYNLKHVLVIEANQAAAGLRSRWSQLPSQGYKVAEVIPYSDEPVWYQHLVERASQSGVHELWLCLPLNYGQALKSIMHALRHTTLDIRYLPDLGDLPLLNHRVSEIAGLYTLDISRSPMEGPNRWLKRLEDVVLGVFISLVALPVCLVIAVAIKLSSPGPVIFKQYRMGINGRPFKVYKFRSMEVHNEADGRVTQAHNGDPRITRLGAFLRRTSLDELPQFYNVLQGRMSIVGPRPHAVAHNEYYKDLVESYMQRHKVKPGITGWAQVNGYRGETDTLEKMEKRVACDLWYIDNWSLWLDLKIIGQTIYKGFINRQP